MIRLLQSDGVTPLGGATFGTIQAGADSASLTFQVRAEGQEHRDVLLLLRTRSPTDPTLWLADGVPPQDELWGRVRVVGEDCVSATSGAASPTWQAPRIPWQPWGAYAGLLLPYLPADCAAVCEWRLHPPSTASELSWTFGVAATYGENARPLPPALGLLHRGILPGTGDGATSIVLRGRSVAASTPADDQVTATAGLWLRAGRVEGDRSWTVQLDQVDGAGAALAAGESYVALLSQGATGAVTVTRGAKAAAPVAPAPPAGELPLAAVTVDHQPGGVSVIEAEDVTDLRPRGRYQARSGLGPQVLLAPGQAVGGGTWRYQGRETPLLLPDDATSHLFLLADGTWTTAPDATPPSPDALGPWWEVDVAGGAVTALRDRRTYAGRAVHLVLRGPTPAAAGGLVDELASQHHRLALEAVTLRASDNGQPAGATTGETVADLLLDGASVFPDPATEDLRPRIPWDAAPDALTDRSAVHTLTEIPRGAVLRFVAAQLPTGGAPERLELHLLCRPL